jgi:hypothetical protein
MQHKHKPTSKMGSGDRRGASSPGLKLSLAADGDSLCAGFLCSDLFSSNDVVGVRSDSKIFCGLSSSSSSSSTPKVSGLVSGAGRPRKTDAAVLAFLLLLLPILDDGGGGGDLDDDPTGDLGK